MGSLGSLTALVGSQLMTVLIAAATAVAVLVILVVFKAMSKPVPGYHPADEAPQPAAPEPAVVANDVVHAAERRRVATPGFVLPLPDEAPRDTTTSSGSAPGFGAPSAPPPPVPSTQPDILSASTDRTVNIGRPEMPSMPAPPAARQVLRNHLVFRNGGRAGEKIRLDTFQNGTCSIGRSDVPENQIVIRDDLKVSRVQHAILTCDANGQISLRDNNSANRVYVNEECLDSGPRSLNSGDRIRIGLTEFEFVQEPVG